MQLARSAARTCARDRNDSRIFSFLLLLPLLAAGCPADSTDGDGGAFGDLDGGSIDPNEQSDAGQADAGDEPVAAGPCSADEALEYRGFLGFGVETQRFCHKVDAPPSGVFVTEDFCFEISADGTGTVDWAGGYDRWGVIEEEGYVRSDSVEAFVWGGEIGSDGRFVIDPSYDALAIYWQNAASGQTVDDQVPLLYWDAGAGEFKNSFPEILSELPSDATSAGCIFLEPTCTTTATEKRCWADGVLDGDYERYDWMGRVDEKGTYTAGVKTGVWTDYSYDSSGIDPEPLSRDEYEYAADGSYYVRHYMREVLTEEGKWVPSLDGGSGSVRDGAWKFYYEPSASASHDGPGLLRREGNYDHGTEVGLWTEYAISYDPPRPDGDYTVINAWEQVRVGVDVCVQSTMDNESDTRTWYVTELTCGRFFCDRPILTTWTSSNGFYTCTLGATAPPDMCPEDPNDGMGATCQ